MNPAKRLSAKTALQTAYFTTEEPAMKKPSQYVQLPRSANCSCSLTWRLLDWQGSGSITKCRPSRNGIAVKPRVNDDRSYTNEVLVACSRAVICMPLACCLIRRADWISYSALLGHGEMGYPAADAWHSLSNSGVVARQGPTVFRKHQHPGHRRWYS